MATWVACGKSPFLLFAAPATIFSLLGMLVGQKKNLHSGALFSTLMCKSEKEMQVSTTDSGSGAVVCSQFRQMIKHNFI